MELTRRSLLALAGAGALAGCAGQLPEPDVTAAGFGEDASGVVRVWTRGATQAGVQGVVEAFHASQDRIRVEVTPVLDGQYVTKLATAIRGREVPDVVDIDDINAMLFIFRDVFTDMTPLVRSLPYADLLSPGHLQLATVGERVYGVPFLADVSMLWANDDLLDRAGVDPASLTTMEAAVDAAERVTALGDGSIGWSLPGNAAGIIGFVTQPHTWATGARLLEGDVGSQTGDVAGNATLRQVLELYRRLQTGGSLQPGAFADAGTTWGADFRAGQVGLFPSNFSSAVLAADADMQARTSVRLLPGPGGGTAFFDGGDNMCMPRGARNPSGAWEFIRFALDVAQQERLPENGFIPIRSDAATDRYRQDFPLAVLPLDQISQGFAPRTLPYNLLYNQPDSPYFALVREAVFGGDVDAALETGQAAYDRILEQAQL
ncbi:sugar ABC transporter substrate-binding protein [uncultured Pseudokineococcus sp.]|uniref:ABC transporter substrate-binding protein n=1 Tax=uncultured Pseudokineococcus sp. TaxID=1642928 RepID=UPI00261BA224|nr:sugar ABC transporter substrate-binding protein [uncultured Pseudokineococcus sp.]